MSVVIRILTAVPVATFCGRIMVFINIFAFFPDQTDFLFDGWDDGKADQLRHISQKGSIEKGSA